MVYVKEIFLVTMTYFISLKKSSKVLSNDNFVKNISRNHTTKKPKNPEINPKTWYVKEKFYVIVEYYTSLETQLNVDLNGKPLENVD